MRSLRVEASAGERPARGAQRTMGARELGERLWANADRFTEHAAEAPLAASTVLRASPSRSKSRRVAASPHRSSSATMPFASRRARVSRDHVASTARSEQQHASPARNRDALHVAVALVYEQRR